MSVDLDITCDDCGGKLNEGDGIYCYDCHDGLENEITELKEKISQLEDEITGLEADITTLEEGLK